MSRQSLPLFTLLLATLMTALYMIAGPAPSLFVYDQQAILDGEIWRLLTGHLVHSDAGHLIWNLAGTLIVGGLLETRLRASILIAALCGVMTVDLYLLLQSQVQYYCGFSGLLNTWLLLLLSFEFRDRAARPFVIATAIGLALKLWIEMASGSAIFTDTAWPSLSEAHLAGLAGGVLWRVLAASRSNQTDPFGNPLANY